MWCVLSVSSCVARLLAQDSQFIFAAKNQLWLVQTFSKSHENWKWLSKTKAGQINFKLINIIDLTLDVGIIMQLVFMHFFWSKNHSNPCLPYTICLYLCYKNTILRGLYWLKRKECFVVYLDFSIKIVTTLQAFCWDID